MVPFFSWYSYRQRLSQLGKVPCVIACVGLAPEMSHTKPEEVVDLSHTAQQGEHLGRALHLGLRLEGPSLPASHVCPRPPRPPPGLVAVWNSKLSPNGSRVSGNFDESVPDLVYPVFINQSPRQLGFLVPPTPNWIRLASGALGPCHPHCHAHTEAI